ncbi:hypothetical protein PIB30_085607 [Stylosanthes scabra]|uniref:Uncharacterized protein n=1 Tax=Stylosanthes scabra TaxID=79078 RepID=A0ABU6TTK2_9FABA|nr:hypothetical protein [Stylosanthes scabra]
MIWVYKICIIGLEKELAATKDQVDALTAERDSALAAPLLTAKIDSLTEELRLAEGGCLSSLARMKEVEESAKVQAAELESCRSALEQQKKKVLHLNPAIDYSMITLDTPWDPKAKRVYNPKAETQEQSEPAAEDQPEPIAKEQPEALVEQQTEKTLAGEGGGCPT